MERSDEPVVWRGRRVLVTGADGFVGSHVCERLLELGAEVQAFVHASSTAGTVDTRLRNLGPVQSRLAAVVAGDIAGADAVSRMAALEPDVVLHLAADAYVPRSFESPREVLRTNVDGTANVLELGRRLGGARIVVTSSSEVYGPAQTEQIDEDHPLMPTSPYAASKVAADRLAYAYHVTYGLDVTIVRPFNTYGPRHHYDVIPKFIRRALRGEPLTVHGTGEQARDFTYVSDTVDGLLRASAHPRARGQTLNLGSGRAVSIATLATTIARLCGSNSAVVHDAPRLAEVQRLCCDAGRAQALLGWRAQVELADGLRDNIAWARAAGWGR